MNSKINKIARKIVMASGNNVFDDYFAFYSDSKWVLQICRKLISVLKNLSVKISNYNTNIVIVDQYVQYLSDVKLDEMNTKQATSQIKSQLKQIKKAYDNYLKQQDQEKKNKLLEKYKGLIIKISEFVSSYEKSSVNIFKNRYEEDQADVSNLLDIIRGSGAYVLIQEQRK